MRLTIYQIDAFTNKIFGGNPAAVIPLKDWLDEDLMQKIALENNLSETVFFVPSSTSGADFDIRWFTPEVEINLCGHATLASAYVLFELLDFNKPEIIFSSKSGLLQIRKTTEGFAMNFPSWKPERFDEYPAELRDIFGETEIVGVYKNRDILVELQNEEAVQKFIPDYSLLKKHIDKMIITAPGKNADFVSRFFAPGAGVDEDPVTGSAHAQLIPFWAEKLGKAKLHAMQLSKRGGELFCEQLDEKRVSISGTCVFFMRGEIVL